MALRLSIKYILFRIGKYHHSMMPLFRQERCAPRAPIRCHADFTSGERKHHLAQHDNLFAIAATKVCNYCDNSGFTNQSPGHHCVTLSGRVHHFLTRVSSSNPQSCGLSYFVFDSLVSCACLSESGNVDEELLNDIRNGLKNENPYCKDLQQLGIHV
jgi:hypothetical protein